MSKEFEKNKHELSDYTKEYENARKEYVNARNDPNIMDPEVFAAHMKIFSDYANNEDPEDGHIFMDGLMIVLLKKLGYDKAMRIFCESNIWYA